MTSITDKVDRLFIQWDKPDSPGCALTIIQNAELTDISLNLSATMLE